MTQGNSFFGYDSRPLTLPEFDVWRWLNLGRLETSSYWRSTGGKLPFGCPTDCAGPSLQKRAPESCRSSREGITIRPRSGVRCQQAHCSARLLAFSSPFSFPRQPPICADRGQPAPTPTVPFRLARAIAQNRSGSVRWLPPRLQRRQAPAP